MEVTTELTTTKLKTVKIKTGYMPHVGCQKTFY